MTTPAASTANLAAHLRAFDFQNLFVSGLGWNYHRGQPPVVGVDGVEYQLRPVAEKAGFAVFVCAPTPDGGIPDYPTRRKLEAQIAKLAYENIVIFADADHSRQAWHWVKRETGKSPVARERHYHAGQDGIAIAQRLQELEFTLEQEAANPPDIADVANTVRRALDVERVTKRFYERFQQELKAFQEFISGIPELGNRQWYASLMLNRLMFVYFIQKQGFLDGDTDYLRNRLQQVRQQAGDGQFHDFYRLFLLRLFHEGLGQPEADRAPELARLLGQVPFLNGGLFDVHDLERGNPQLNIPDQAFARVFNFFEAYQWHLDEWHPDDPRRRNDNEINPDVLGYIFEKYVNQKQMGAYYTKEDITGYITRSAAIPWLFNAAQKECPVAFVPGGGVWQLLPADPDRYIYPAVAHGVDRELPEHIAAGIPDATQRADWNQPAPAEYALPTETWRELIARRQRHAALNTRLLSGAVNDINELVTLNLDLEKFALDAIAQAEGTDLLNAFWRALTRVSILDPACGSGAFLFTALNILEPLYTAAIAGMRGFVADLEISQRPRNPNRLSNFKQVLDDMEHHPGERYYILKSIILNNLYGVDLMDEAVEICRLRLFLKLAAQLQTYDRIEPLPDIDFNIRAGNTLVGFTSMDALRRAMTVTPDGQYRALDAAQQAAAQRIEEDAEIAARAFDQFRLQQTALGGTVTAADKAALSGRLDRLRDRLDRHLADEYGVNANDAAAYAAWKRSHQPFHWLVEFYGIMNGGGFDVVIGNPPYLEFREVDYICQGFACHNTKAIHALMVEQGINLAGKNGRVSMIVPIAITSTQRMAVVKNMIEASRTNAWFANFAWRPGKLFETVNRALTIFAVGPAENPMSYSTGYLKWTKDDRDGLFERIAFAEVPRSKSTFYVPKLSTDIEQHILMKMAAVPTTASNFIGNTVHRVFHRHTGGLYWKVFTDFAPAFYVNGEGKSSSTATNFSTSDSSQVRPLIAALSSDIFWWWYTVTSNLRDLNPTYIRIFPIPQSVFTDAKIKELADCYLDSLVANSTMLVRNQQSTGRTETQAFKISESKPIIDEIDRALAPHYGLTQEELDFIVNYDIKYRMGNSD